MEASLIPPLRLSVTPSFAHKLIFHFTLSLTADIVSLLPTTTLHIYTTELANMSQLEWNRTPPVKSSDGNQRKKPNRVIPVPHEYRRKTLAREGDKLVQDLKIETDCEVILRWDQGKVTQFDIIGSSAGVEKAVRQINHWISNAHVKSKESSAWAKMPAFDGSKWLCDAVEKLERERKETYKGTGGEHQLHSVGYIELVNAVPILILRQTIVDWPEELSNQSATPRDVFGHKLQALDAIRMEDEVYITLLPVRGGLWQIKISASVDNNINNAKSRLQIMIQKTRADFYNVRPVLNILLDEREGIDIVLREPELWWPDRNGTIIPHLLHHPMMGIPGDYRPDGMYFSDLLKIQGTIKLALENVQHKKGAYDFVVRLGCLALDSKNVGNNVTQKKFRKEQFLKDVNDRVGLDVKKWLTPYELGDRILSRLITEDKVLEPTKSNVYYGHTPSTLKETRPIFRGAWLFRDPASAAPTQQLVVRHSGGSTSTGLDSRSNKLIASSTSVYVVQIDWTDNEDGTYEKTDTRYYKLEDGKSGPQKYLDLNILELGESRGWQFALESLIGPLASKMVSPILTGFAQRVRMKPNYNASSAEVFAQWDTSTPTVSRHLITGRLDKVYSFGIQKTCYKVELTAMWYPNHKLPVWGLAVRHTEWAIHLAELERLPIGCRAEWGNILATFLPDDGQMSCATKEDEEFGIADLTLDEHVKARPRDGMRLLIGKLMQLSGIVSSVVSSNERGASV